VIWLRRPAGTIVVTGLIGVAIAIYLTATRLAGVAPICGPSGGCETVENSPYSAVAGIPVAFLGLLFSATAVSAALWWDRTGDRRSLYGLYALGLTGSLVEAFLVYLEVFVIHAICLWCAAYGITVVVGWLLALRALRSNTA
jgi:uncharacterized membrane protein